MSHPRIIWWLYPMADSDEIQELGFLDVRQAIIYSLVLSEDRQRQIKSRLFKQGIHDLHLVGNFDAILHWVDRLPNEDDRASEFEQEKLRFFLTGKTGKERSMAAVSIEKTILAVGADTTAFDEQTLRDPRVCHWGAGDIQEGASIPEGIGRVISCDASLRRQKTDLFKKILGEARNSGRQIRSWEVPHQGRLREVLAEQLGEAVVSDLSRESSGESSDGGGTAATHGEVSVAEPGVETPAEVVPAGAVFEQSGFETQLRPDVSDEAASDVGQQGDADKGEVETMDRMSISDIVRANMEATGGDVEALVKIIRKQYPTKDARGLKAAIYGPRAAWFKKHGSADANKGTLRQLGGLAKPPASAQSEPMVVSPIARIKIALAQIEEGARMVQEGLEWLNVAVPEIAGMDERLKLLAPIEAAMKQVAGSMQVKEVK